MLKLMQVENTNIFAIADTNKKNEVDGFVRIEKESELDEIKVFDKKDETYFEKVKELTDSKRKELYKMPEEEKKELNVFMLILHYFYISKRDYISARKVLRLLAHVFVYMSKKRLLQNYNFEYNLDEDSILTKAIKSKFFRVDQVGAIIYLMDDKKMMKYISQNPLEDVVAEMVEEFAKNNEFV